jgi:hypothetical protein
MGRNVMITIFVIIGRDRQHDLRELWGEVSLYDTPPTLIILHV